MPTKLSAGLLVYRSPGLNADVEVILVHPGGPFWARKDDGAWSVPKGEYLADEEPLAAAMREFKEEIGIDPPPADVLELGTLKQPSGKKVTVFAIEGDIDLAKFVSNTFPLEWPPKSGKVQEFPEADRAEWMPLERARTKLLKGQVPFLDLLVERLHAPGY